MRTPIAHALAYPERIDAGVTPLDLCAIGQLSFERPDARRFPCLPLAYQALSAGGSASTLLNAANEVAVAAFLAGRLPYLAIADIIAGVLDAIPGVLLPDLEAVMSADAEARATAAAAVEKRQ